MSDPGQWRSNASEGNFASDPSSRVMAEAGTQIALAALPSLMVPPTDTPIVTPSPCDPSGWSDQPASAWGIYFRRISALAPKPPDASTTPRTASAVSSSPPRPMITPATRPAPVTSPRAPALLTQTTPTHLAAFHRRSARHFPYPRSSPRDTPP